MGGMNMTDINTTDINYVTEIQEVISSGRVLNVLIVDASKMLRTAGKRNTRTWQYTGF